MTVPPPLIGAVVDAILLLVALEALVLVILNRRRGIGPSPARLLPNLLAGGCLLLALRAALGGLSGGIIALWLALAGVAHGADLVQRWHDR